MNEKRNRMVIGAVILLTFLALLGTTNPGKRDHYPVVEQMVAEGLETVRGGTGDSFMDMFFHGFGFFDGMYVDRLLNDVTFHSATLFSYTCFTNSDDASCWTTIGILGHVFPLHHDELNAHIAERLYGKPQQQREKPKEERKKTPQPESLPEDGVML